MLLIVYCLIRLVLTLPPSYSVMSLKYSKYKVTMIFPYLMYTQCFTFQLPNAVPLLLRQIIYF